MSKVRVWIDKDEMYPVYSLPGEIPDWDFIQEDIIEMEEKDRDRLIESYRVAGENWWAIQRELGELLEKNKKS